MQNIKRHFIIGSEWIYYKIYMGTQTIDHFIINYLPDILEEEIIKKNIIKWFFIRYNDPDPHIRIRFLINDVNNIGFIISILYKKLDTLVSKKMAYKVVLDTYNREIERYHNELIEFSEEFFYINSKQVLTNLQSIDFNSENRWLLVIKMIDTILNSFKLDLKSKKDLLETMKMDFGDEFKINKFTRKQLNKKYRDSANMIKSTLKEETEDESYFHELYSKIAKDISQKTKDQEIINSLLYSYLHMLCNRSFHSKQRINEWVCYDLLFQYYKSEYGIQKYLK
ncbi:hypothetical protein UJ101_01068 [Flavobacteriaceae bacterium UJ101]|nr:hypothetical protein UJ101_01068 [Flavobacteriaceae bacterium UJ101]